MTKFTITTANSKHTTLAFDHAFAESSGGADSLILQAGAYLTTSGVGSQALRLDQDSAWQISIDGRVESQKYDGIHLVEGNANVTEIDIGETGRVSGGASAIYALSNITLTNRGIIEGGVRAAIEVTGNGRNLVVNHGRIEGSSYSFLDTDGRTDDSIRNTGTMSGKLALGKGDDRLQNSGVINGDLKIAYLDLGAGDDRVVNTGSIELPIVDTSGDDTFSNSGVIKVSVDLGIGEDVFTNVSRAKGRMISGSVGGPIQLGDGDDRLVGGKFVEDYRDGGGSDVADLGGGNDVYRAIIRNSIDGTDRIDGGNGRDAYDASETSVGVYINLDSVKHKLPFNSGHLEIKAGTALGTEIAGTKSDRLVNFENVFGGAGADVIYGSSKGNYISGGGGLDNIEGLKGDDYLVGGTDMDFLAGGAGHDLLEGGTGADLFIFQSAKDSAVGGTRRDVILDFLDGDDVIDLHGIDAVKGRGDDAFTFIGMGVAFSGEAGELRSFRSGNGHVIEGDIDGDKKADFSIGVADEAKSTVFTAEDFQL